LSRPDFYDWPRRLAYVSRVLQPDVAVAFFGANDAQAVDFNGRVLGSESSAWDALYAQRVGQAMDTLLRGGATRVYWVGLPIMGSTAFSRAVRVLDTIYRREAAARPGVVFVDTWSMFATPRGAYSAYLRDAHGELQLMRQSDGVHMTLAGAARLGWAIVARSSATTASAARSRGSDRTCRKTTASSSGSATSRRFAPVDRAASTRTRPTAPCACGTAQRHRGRLPPGAQSAPQQDDLLARLREKSPCATPTRRGRRGAPAACPRAEKERRLTDKAHRARRKRDRAAPPVDDG